MVEQRVMDVWPPEGTQKLAETSVQTEKKSAIVHSWKADGFFSAQAREAALQSYAETLDVKFVPSLNGRSFNSAVEQLASEATQYYQSPSWYLYRHTAIAPEYHFSKNVRIGPMRTSLISSLSSHNDKGLGSPTRCVLAGTYQNLLFLYVPDQEDGTDTHDVNEDFFKELATHPLRQTRVHSLQLGLYARPNALKEAEQFLHVIMEGQTLSDFAADEYLAKGLESLEIELVDGGDLWLLPPGVASPPVQKSYVAPHRILYL